MSSGHKVHNMHTDYSTNPYVFLRQLAEHTGCTKHYLKYERERSIENGSGPALELVLFMGAGWESIYLEDSDFRLRPDTLVSNILQLLRDDEHFRRYRGDQSPEAGLDIILHGMSELPDELRVKRTKYGYSYDPYPDVCVTSPTRLGAVISAHESLRTQRM